MWCLVVGCRKFEVRCSNVFGLHSCIGYFMHSVDPFEHVIERRHRSLYRAVLMNMIGLSILSKTAMRPETVFSSTSAFHHDRVPWHE